MKNSSTGFKFFGCSSHYYLYFDIGWQCCIGTREGLDAFVEIICSGYQGIDVNFAFCRAVTLHVIRHTTAMHLLQSGVDITIIALWLGHEDTATRHMYVEADLTMKEQALMKLQPIGSSAGRFRASDELMTFLKSLRSC